MDKIDDLVHIAESGYRCQVFVPLKRWKRLQLFWLWGSSSMISSRITRRRIFVRPPSWMVSSVWRVVGASRLVSSAKGPVLPMDDRPSGDSPAYPVASLESSPLSADSMRSPYSGSAEARSS